MPTPSFTRVFSAVLVVALSACPMVPGSDGGTGGGSGGGSGGGTGGGTGGGSAQVARAKGVGNALVLLNGQFYVAGNTSTTEIDTVLARFHADGGLDTTFGDGGSIVTPFPTYVDPLLADAGFPADLTSDLAYAIVAQGQKLILGGTSGAQGPANGGFSLARYSADGQLDPTFGTAGMVNFRPVESGHTAQVHALALRGDGKLYAGGMVSVVNGFTRFAIARFSADGVYDMTFGGGSSGAIGTDNDGGVRDVRGMAFQANKVVFGGGDDFAASRFDDYGALDGTFGTGGVATSPGGTAYNFKAQADGKLLLAGTRRTVTDGPWVVKLVRYTADGQLDATFGTGGMIETPLDGHQIVITGMDVLSDGRIVVNLVGGWDVIRNPYLSVARFTSSGAVDTTFGTMGLTELHFDLPLLGFYYPATPNRALVVDGRLYWTDVDLYSTSSPTIAFSSISVQ